MGAYKKVVVGTDGSKTSLLAVDRAGKVAAASDAQLVIVTAFEPASREEVLEAQDALRGDAFMVVGSAPAESILKTASGRARKAGATQIETIAVEGNAISVLDKAVTDTGADLVVVGNVGLNSLSGRILGSVPQTVARRADIDVLIVHTS
jgi:nucleotide-binding universal stress UspA family protein